MVLYSWSLRCHVDTMLINMHEEPRLLTKLINMQCAVFNIQIGWAKLVEEKSNYFALLFSYIAWMYGFINI